MESVGVKVQGVKSGVLVNSSRKSVAPASSDWLEALKMSGRADEAEAFAAGYRKGNLKGACTAQIDLLMNKAGREYVSPYDINLQNLFRLQRFSGRLGSDCG